MPSLTAISAMAHVTSWLTFLQKEGEASECDVTGSATHRNIICTCIVKANIFALNGRRKFFCAGGRRIGLALVANREMSIVAVSRNRVCNACQPAWGYWIFRNPGTTPAEEIGGASRRGGSS